MSESDTGMSKRLVGLCCLLLGLSASLARDTAGISTTADDQKTLVKDAVFHSVSLERDMHYRLLLPHNYSAGAQFPALYLLHGIYGDYLNWDTRTRLENYARDLDLIIVMPDADDSWYTNSTSAPADKFEDYITKDLISEIDEKYRTSRERQARAIAGLSMGGYGAVKLALKHSDLFAFAGSLSGAFNATQNLDDLKPEFRAKLVEVFGKNGSSARAQNDVFSLLRAAPEYPYFYVACGTADFFLTTNRAFVAQLSAQNVLYEYHETAGGHSWEYWDRALEPLLRAVERGVASRPRPVKGREPGGKGGPR